MTALLLLCCTVASAADFEVGGLYYNILSSEDKTVEVTSGGNGYSGAVTIPGSVTYNSITYSVTSIGNYAFRFCFGLTSIEIPSSVTSIGDEAFYYCYLTSIEIPSSVTSIGDRAFSWCSGLTSIVVGDGNSVYDSRNNCNAIIETASNTLIVGCKNTIIPEGVTSIGDWAFFYCRGLTSIEIPSSVTSIGNQAFIGCDGLTSIEIPSSVTSIGYDAFSSCDGLTSIEIPSSVTSIGKSAFGGCDDLTSIVVDEGNTIYNSRGNCNAIIETASNTLIAGCVNTIIPEGVTSIGEAAFYDCTGLTSIEIPSSVTSIGEGAFYGCTGLTSIEIPSSVTSIGDFAFHDCTGLTSVTIGNGVTSIGKSAFYWCSGLTSVEIPSSVTSIGDFAFHDCTGLTSIEIPSSVTSIGNYVFSNCTGLTSITSHIAAEDLFIPGSYAFNGIDKDACTLYVPAGAKSTYAATEQWRDFTNIVEMSSDGSDATAIESVETESTAPAVYYDLSGRRVENPAKGIYIVNGRKVFIK